MLKTFSALALAAALSVPVQAAAAHDHDADRVEHYAVENKPKTVAEARVQLHSGTAAIAEATQAANWEKVHELTYGVEAALELLNTTTNTQEKAVLETYAYVLEEIHLASEHAKADVIKANLPILQFIAQEYKKSFN